MQITVNNEIFRGLSENLVKVLEARGYQAERENLNPHPFFQHAEFLKYEQVDNRTGRAVEQAMGSSERKRNRSYDRKNQKRSNRQTQEAEWNILQTTDQVNISV